MQQKLMLVPDGGWRATKVGQYLITGKWNKSTPVAAKKGGDTIITQIVGEFKNNTIQDLQNWRQALDAWNDVERPSCYLLQDLFDYLEPDAQLGISKDIRVGTTLAKKFIVYDKASGKEIPEKTALLKDKEWFFNFVWNFLETVFCGVTVAQLTDPVLMKFDYLPRRNLIPQKDFFLFSVSGEKGVRYTDPAFANSVIYVKYKHAYGILNDIVPNLIWKKNARQAWAEFAEKFGIPPIWATTTKRDKKSLDDIENMLKQLGEAATAVLPEGTKVEIQDQAAKGDPYKVWQEQLILDDEAIAKRFLGGTMITDDGASRSQSEVHERTLNDVIGLFDKMLITFVVNDQLMPIMAANGYPFTENDAFKFDESEQLGLKDFWGIVKEVLDSYEVDMEWLSRTFNIPIKAEKQKPTVTPPTNFNEASTAMAAALEAKGVKLPVYISHCGHHPEPVAAGFNTRLLEELSLELINDVWDGKETLITEVLKSIESNSILRDGLFDGWSNRTQVSYDSTDTHCLAMMEYNLFEFSRLKEKSNVFALNQLLIDQEKNNVRSFGDFRDQAMKYLHNPDMNWLYAEYNHTIAVGQGASRYNQFINEKDKVTKFGVIQTAGDSRVRPAHKVLDGRIVDFEEPGGLKIWVPFDIGCRCEILQHLGKPGADQLITSSGIYEQIDKKPTDKWTGNRAVTEQVFTRNEMYMKELELASESNSLTYDKYGLKKWDDIKETKPAIQLDTSITPDNTSNLFKPEKGKDFIGYQDYLGRKMVMTKSVFDYHTQAKYTRPEENRHQLFPHIEDVLKEPDEVYLVQYGKGNKLRFQTNYLKFYNDEVLVVNTQPGSDKVEINTWYRLKAGEDKVRAGYLIKGNKKTVTLPPLKDIGNAAQRQPFDRNCYGKCNSPKAETLNNY